MQTSSNLKICLSYKSAYFQGLLSTLIKNVGRKMSFSMAHRNQANQFENGSKFS